MAGGRGKEGPTEKYTTRQSLITSSEVAYLRMDKHSGLA
jgi:hypothetical protein